MLMSGSHFSDFINRTLQQVMNAPRRSVIGWWVEQTATAIDRTQRTRIRCICLHGCSPPHLRGPALISLTLGILCFPVSVMVSFPVASYS